MKPSIAFLFLTRSNLHHPHVWQTFLDQGQERCKAYCHSKHRHDLTCPIAGSRQIEAHIDTGWGQASLVRAMIELIKAALEDQADHQYFVFASESCIPIRSFDHVYRALTKTNKSWIPTWHDRSRYASVDQNQIPEQYFLKSMQWIALRRDHAEIIAQAPLLNAFDHVFAADEHYFASVLATLEIDWLEGIHPHGITDVRWEGGHVGHPKTYNEINLKDLIRLREGKCLFARKFSPKVNVDELAGYLLDQSPLSQLLDESGYNPEDPDVFPVSQMTEPQIRILELRQQTCLQCPHCRKTGHSHVFCSARSTRKLSFAHDKCPARQWPNNGITMPKRPKPTTIKFDPHDRWRAIPPLPRSVIYRRQGQTKQSASNDIFVYGFPGLYGGAATELYHQILLWQKIGYQTHLIPCHANYKHEALYQQMLDIGVLIYETNAFNAIKPGAPVFGYCDEMFLEKIDKILEYSTNTVFVNCMTWRFSREKIRMREGKIGTFLYQNPNVLKQAKQELQEINSDPSIQFLCFKPYLDTQDFPFVSNKDPNTFTIGRISRHDADKFSSDTLEIWEQIQSPVPKQGHMLGFGKASQKKIGTPGNWIKTYTNQNELSTKQFYRQCDVIIQSSDTTENWPRVGLEAMACGVIVLANDRGGWQQQIKHGENGYLCQTTEDFVHHASKLAESPDLRQQIAQNAYEHVQTLTGASSCAESWHAVLNALGSKPKNKTNTTHQHKAINTHQTSKTINQTYRAKPNPTLIVGVSSTIKPEYQTRRHQCLETWLPILEQKGIEVVFIVGLEDKITSPRLVTSEEHGRIGTELQLPCPDSYDALPQKAAGLCKWALANREFKHLFKCDDDTYLVPQRLLDVNLQDIDYLGNEWKTDTQYASGGAGYFLSQQSAQLISESPRMTQGPEDLIVGDILQKSGIKFKKDKRFIAFGTQTLRPTLNNDLITTHGCEAPWASHQNTWTNNPWDGPKHAFEVLKHLKNTEQWDSDSFQIKHGDNNISFDFTHLASWLKLHSQNKKVYLKCFNSTITQEIASLGIEKLLHQCGIGFENKENNCSKKETKQSSLLVISAPNGFRRTNPDLPNIINKLTKQYDQIVIMPTIFDYAYRHPKVTAFCRDRKSLNTLNLPDSFLCPDTSLALQKQNLCRKENEKNANTKHDAMMTRIEKLLKGKQIKSDDLHTLLIGIIAGKPIIAQSNPDPSLADFYETWLEKYQLATWLPIKIKQQLTSKEIATTKTLNQKSRISQALTAPKV